jgi:hypothetical protein
MRRVGNKNCLIVNFFLKTVIGFGCKKKIEINKIGAILDKKANKNE